MSEQSAAPTPETGAKTGAETDAARQHEPYRTRISLAEEAQQPPRHVRPREEERGFTLESSWVLIAGFALIILLGALLLKLPSASAMARPLTWEEAFFTSTSATTVTGLAVLTTATDFSRFGQVVILVLLQVGGVGFIAFSVLLFRLIGRRLTLQTRFIVQQSLGASRASGVVELALYILAVTVAIEAVGAGLLWLRWRTTMSDGEAAWQAMFHAISSYCNAGFDLFAGAGRGVLFGYGTDPYTLFVMGTLIVLGGLGIAVLYDLWSLPRDRMLSLHTRLTLLLSLVLTGVGVLVVLADPALESAVQADVTGAKSRWEAALVGLFTIVSARTAGLTIIPLDQLSEATQLIIMLWMFIGGAPASMAGGVTLSTVSVLLVTVAGTVRGRDDSIAFGRTIPLETITKAVAIMTVSTLLVAAVTLWLSLAHAGALFPVGFEVISAFANAGYSLNFTGELDSFGRFLIAFTMFWGRLGPLTVVVALAQREHRSLLNYPEEAVPLG